MEMMAKGDVSIFGQFSLAEPWDWNFQGYVHINISENEIKAKTYIGNMFAWFFEARRALETIYVILVSKIDA